MRCRRPSGPVSCQERRTPRPQIVALVFAVGVLLVLVAAWSVAGLAWWKWRSAPAAASTPPGSMGAVTAQRFTVAASSDSQSRTIALPPLPEPLPITLSGIEQRTVLDLPDKVAGVAVGGGGRFLALHFPAQQRIGLFDANEARLTRFLPVPDERLQLTAGMNCLLVLAPSTGVVEKFDLLTGTSAGRRSLTTGPVGVFCMGSASNGPLLITDDQGLRFVDLADYQTLAAWPNQGPADPSQRGWASANGQLFGLIHSRTSRPSGINALSVADGRLQHTYAHKDAFFVQPGPDGRHLYVGGLGLQTALAQTIPEAIYSGDHAPRFDRQFLPAPHGAYYAHLHLQSDEPDAALHCEDPAHGLTIYRLGQTTAVQRIATTDLVTPATSWQLGDLGIEQTVHLIPDAGLVVVLPPSRDRLVLLPLELPERSVRADR